MNDIPPTEVVYTGMVMISAGEKQMPVHEKPAIQSNVEFKVINDNTGKEIGTIPVSAKNSKFTFAIGPGNYTVVVKGKGTSEYKKSIYIADEQPPEPVIIENVVLSVN